MSGSVRKRAIMLPTKNYCFTDKNSTPPAINRPLLSFEANIRAATVLISDLANKVL